MRDYQLIIFDWDGTLMDSVGRIVASMQAAAESVDFTAPSFDQTKNIIGLSLSQGVQQLFPGCSLAQEQTIITEYKAQYLSKNTVATQLFLGAENLLVQLKANNKRLAIATGKGREGINRVLTETNMGRFFHTTYSADDALSKPDPQMLHLILQELNIDAQQAVMIGDTTHDLNMAQQAGIDSIGVSYGVHKENELQRYEPKAIVHSIAQLQTLLLT